MNLSVQKLSVGILAALTLFAGAVPAALAQGPPNLALSATATGSSFWEEDKDPPNPTFVPAKINDGDPGSRWNSRGNESVDAWLALTWPSDVSFNKIAVDQAFNRITSYRIDIQKNSDEWLNIYDSDGTNVNPTNNGNPTFINLFPGGVVAKAVRFYITGAPTSTSIYEIRVYNTTLGTLTGKVKVGNTPIEGANVVVGSGGVAQTDSQGNYTLNVEAGTTDITASKLGEFRSRTSRNVNLQAGANTLDFSLDPVPTNLARTALAAASSDYSPDYDGPKTNDGKYDTRWNSAGGDQNGSWVTLTWDSAQTFNSVAIIDFWGRITDFTIQRYDDAAADYVDIINRKLPAGTDGTDRTVTTLLPADVTAKEIRILINEARSLPSIYEIEVTKVVFGSLTAKATDLTTGQGIPDATITLTPFGALAPTNAQGEVTASVLPDEYLIQATAPGYFESEVKVVAVNTGTPATVTLALPAKGPNIALTGTATASSAPEENPATFINDGDLATRWTSGLSEETGLPLTTDQWVALNFANPVTFNVINIDWADLYPVVQRSRFERLDDNGQWVAIPNTSFNPEAYHVAGQRPRFILTPPLTTKGIRYFMEVTNGVESRASIPEIQLFNSAIGGGTGGGCKGDANGDSKIDVNDAVAILRHATSISLLTGQARVNADIDGDGTSDAGVNVADAVKVLQYIVNIPGTGITGCQ